MPASIVEVVSVYAAATPVTTSAFAVAPPLGDIVLSLVDSSTVMNAGPSGATLRDSFVGNQGAYVYDKTAGGSEPNTVTVTPNGAFSTALAALDLAGVSGFDAISTVAQTQGTPGQASRAISSITTAAGSGDLVIAFAMLHGIGSDITAPSWNNGFTHLAQVGAVATGAGECVLLIGYKLVAASTAVGTTTVSWSGGCSNSAAWMIGYQATASGGPQTVSPSGIASAETLGTPTVALGSVTVSPSGIASAQAVGVPVVTPGAVSVSPPGIASAQTVGTPTVTPGPVTVAPAGIASSGAVGVPTVTGGSVIPAFDMELVGTVSVPEWHGSTQVPAWHGEVDVT